MTPPHADRQARVDDAHLSCGVVPDKVVRRDFLFQVSRGAHMGRVRFVVPGHGHPATCIKTRSQSARKRKAVVKANSEKAKVEKERGELREAFNILEAHGHLGTGTRQYDSEDGTRASRVKKH